MRPRHKAAENVRIGMAPVQGPAAASMRPRHKAAENALARWRLDANSESFNEAAA